MPRLMITLQIRLSPGRRRSAHPRTRPDADTFADHGAYDPPATLSLAQVAALAGVTEDEVAWFARQMLMVGSRFDAGQVQALLAELDGSMPPRTA